MVLVLWHEKVCNLITLLIHLADTMDDDSRRILRRSAFEALWDLTNVRHSTVEERFLQYWDTSSKSAQEIIKGSFKEFILVRNALEHGSPTNRLESNRVEVPPEISRLTLQVARWLRDIEEETSFSGAIKEIPTIRPRKRRRISGGIVGSHATQANLGASDAGATVIARI